ncbi:porin [Vibrio sp. 10N.286.51.C3]|uniref:porin n=1 Tax=unclassified Vibrio TaxID=2614977 RepID=UPI000D39FA0A|nr:MULTISPECIES: porin [unclassified Vibrio]CAK3925489.1 Porin [Vibrio crassostreae]PTO98210.1 porin [Vibrio sp. 10N.286.48.B8]PTP17144.1 porin [Vibrio sp. 10N.286.51.C3]PTQ05951.1 porin [Vibrio sp. ZF 223]TKE68650.1 porin [Vibrio sp. F12]
MKKTLVALAIASISTSAFAVNTSSQNSQNEEMFAFDSMHKDQFSVAGSFGVGGYYDTGSKAFYDDWATGLTLAVSYRNNRFVGYFETDMMLNYTTDNNVAANDAATSGWVNGIDTGPATDVDKAWLGFDTGYGIASFGWENDTALDKVDGAGDNTYEFGASAGDASDAFNVVKFQGATNGIAYAISYFETNDDHNDAEKGVNGYIGIEQEVFSVYAGYEARDDEKDYEVYTVTGSMQLGSMKLGLNSWIDQNDEMKNTGFYFSGGYTLSDDLTIAAGYAFNTNEEDNLSDVDSSYINVAAMYRIADNADMGIDIKQDIEGARSIGNTQYDEETHVFAAAYYYF